MATINQLRLKPEWERWLADQAQPSQSPATSTPGEANWFDEFASQGVEPRVFNEILWQAVKRQWRARLAAQQLPQAGQDGQGQDRD